MVQHGAGNNMATGDRLREERERLHLSQADLAEKAGIHRNTQARYENARGPLPSNYVSTLMDLGLDVDFILYGIANPDTPVDCPFAREQHLHFSYLFTLKHCRERASGRRGGALSSSLNMLWHRACGECPKNPIKSLVATPASVNLDGALLAAILEAFDAALGDRFAHVSPHKRAQAVVMLYRGFKTSGKFDADMVKSAAKLAS